jgi:hypothetical protein
MSVLLLCEGASDKRLLSHVLDAEGLDDVEIHAVAGCSGLGAVRSYAAQQRQFSVVVSVGDRDYRDEAAALATWSDDSLAMLWPRHEIENYLLDPVVVAAAMQELLAAPAYTYEPALPTTEPAAFQLLIHLAKSLAEDHAGECTRAELGRLVAGLSLDYSPRKPKVRDQAGWLSSLSAESSRLRAQIEAALALPALEADEAGKRYGAVLDALDDRFFSSGAFLLHIAGATLLTRLRVEVKRRRRKRGKDRQSMRTPRKSFEDAFDDTLVDAFGAVYKAGRYRPTEFQKLATLLRR